MLKQVDCDLCGGNDAATIFAGDANCEAIVRCRNCGFIYQNPRRDIPVDYAEWSSPAIEEAIKEYEEQYLLERAAKEISFRGILDEISRYKGSGRLLDVGSSYGFFLDLARERGWDVSGIDPYTPAVEWSRAHLGLDVRRATLLESKFPDAHFDAVVMVNVLEHVPSPCAELLEVNRILKPEGLLFVEVPNVDNIWVKLLRKRWRYFLDVHYSHFGPATISKFLEKTGFRLYKRSSAPRVVSVNHILQRMRQLGYLNSSIGSFLERVLIKSRIGKARLKIDLRDGMRVFAGKI